jgi:uncharacterized protein (DUF952 family)
LTEPIFHLAQPRDWAGSTDEYRAASLDDEGFIHCSTAGQLARVARELFGGSNDLILLTIDPEALGDALVFEDLYDAGEDFPHIYGPLPTTGVLATGPYLAHLEEGLWLDTRFDRAWMDRVLHPDFSEVGHSGRTYNRDEVLDTPAEAIEIELPHEGYHLELIDEDVALVRYISRARRDGVEQAAQRTSVWVNTNEGWRLRFHQGTLLP